MDAGPHVKVLTLSHESATLRGELEAVTGVRQVIVSGAGEGARIVGRS
jgi:mevalonate pyrophosphate decarboxylase